MILENIAERSNCVKQRKTYTCLWQIIRTVRRIRETDRVLREWLPDCTECARKQCAKVCSLRSSITAMKKKKKKKRTTSTITTNQHTHSSIITLALRINGTEFPSSRCTSVEPVCMYYVRMSCVLGVCFFFLFSLCSFLNNALDNKTVSLNQRRLNALNNTLILCDE